MQSDKKNRVNQPVLLKTRELSGACLVGNTPKEWMGEWADMTQQAQYVCLGLKTLEKARAVSLLRLFQATAKTSTKPLKGPHRRPRVLARDGVHASLAAHGDTPTSSAAAA